VGSAHKNAAHVAALLADYEALDRPKVYITVAGLSNALSGFSDGAVNSPVIACPPPCDSLGGADLYSSIRMPPGIAPAYVEDPGNAALLAAKILGLCDPPLAARVASFRLAKAGRNIEDDEAMRKSGASGFGAKA
jgi:phosphoribosylaminoimidazole carboxylase PurE protein